MWLGAAGMWVKHCDIMKHVDQIDDDDAPTTTTTTTTTTTNYVSVVAGIGKRRVNTARMKEEIY